MTNSPTADWIARQITEAFPWDSAPGYLIRDRDRVFGSVVRQRIRAMGIRDKPIAPRSPWQNGFAERLIGSIRRECLDHIIVFGEAHLRRVLRAYASYYNGSSDAPVSEQRRARASPNSAHWHPAVTSRSSADFIISTSGSSFRYTQVSTPKGRATNLMSGARSGRAAALLTRSSLRT